MVRGDKEEPYSAGKITLRPASTVDDEFLIGVYRSTRTEEMAAWGWSPIQQENFVRMQFAVRQRGYAATYPSAETSVISLDDVPIGSVIIFRGRNEIRLVDISLLPEFRGRGVGTDLIGMLLSEATGSRSALRLSVLRSNRAARLYERLGLVAVGGDALYCEMEFVPPERQNPQGTGASLENDVHAGKTE